MCFRPNDVSVADQPLICQSCGNENAPGETECIFCGAQLIQDSSAPAAPPKAPNATGGAAPSPAPAAPKAPGGPR